MLFDSLLQHSQTSPNDLAVVDDHGRYTYQQIAKMALALAAHLRQGTARPHVGLLAPSSAAFMASFYGTLIAGKTVVPINFLLGDREIAHLIADSGIDTVITISQLATRVQTPGLKVIDLAALMQSGPQILAEASHLAQSLPKPNPDDMAVLMYTSGTSGLPKGVMLSYQNLKADIDAAIVHAELRERHKFLGVLPLFHTTGMLATMLAPVQLGTMVVYIARFSAVATIKAIREHGISIMAAVPSMYAALIRLKDAGPADFANMYAAISGGEPLPAAVREGFLQRYNVPIYEGYGLTETIGPIAFNVPGSHRAGSVGRVIPNATVKIADDDGNVAAKGSSGEVLLKGPMVMRGYYNLPDDTAQAIMPDGFFKSGDLGFVDDDGFLHITGRKKDLIIVAGEKAVPREIEEVLGTHPAVAEASVVGRKDALRGEAVVAFVILREGHQAKPEELRDYCRQQNLASFKIPRDVVFVDELPRSPTGKVLKRVLIEQLAQ